MSSFQIKTHWRTLTTQILTEVKSGESLALGLTGEESLFLRFNNSKVRQSTTLDQYFLEMTFQKNNRQTQLSFTMTGQLALDFATAKSLLERAREEVAALPEDPFHPHLENHGKSDQELKGKLPTANEAIEAIENAHSGIDHSGFYCGGPLYRASCNSLGQDHWFSNDAFFYDYSLFTVNRDGANKAVKGCYSEIGWNAKNLSHQIARDNDLLKHMKDKNRSLKPGVYKAYLAPGAMSEISGVLNWGAFTYSSFRQGRSPFAKLKEGKESLSPLLSLGENFELGLSPRFNTMGELAPTTLPIVEQGQLKNWLISTKAAKEYSVTGNAAEYGFRSLEILPGTLAEDEALKNLGTGVYLGNLHYLNWSDVPNARVTGMTRYACFWVENGEIVAPIEDMRFDESLYRIFGSELLGLTRESHLEPDIMTYSRREVGGRKLPGALVKEFRFTL